MFSLGTAGGSSLFVKRAIHLCSVCSVASLATSMKLLVHSPGALLQHISKHVTLKPVLSKLVNVKEFHTRCRFTVYCSQTVSSIPEPCVEKRKKPSLITSQASLMSVCCAVGLSGSYTNWF